MPRLRLIVHGSADAISSSRAIRGRPWKGKSPRGSHCLAGHIQWNTGGVVHCREIPDRGTLDLTACLHMWAAIGHAFPGRLDQA